MASRFLSAIRSIACAGLAALIPAPVVAGPADAIAGTWDVVAVSVDARDQVHWLYGPDDPRLLGRELVVTKAAMSLNDGSAPCRNPAFTPRKAPLSRIVGEAFPGAPGARAASRLADFGLTERPATALAVRCARENDGRPPRQPWASARLVEHPPGRLLMNVGTAALLILQRRPSEARPGPTFPCGGAPTPAQEAICRSIPLAAYDRSVAAALRRAIERRPQDRAAIEAEQAQWLERRDACAADDECLADAMRERVDELMQN